VYGYFIKNIEFKFIKNNIYIIIYNKMITINNDEDLSQFDEYKLYPKEKYLQLLKPHDITNLPLDEFITINGIKFKMLDDLKIYILENNIKLSLDGKEDIFTEPYQYQNMSDDDIKNIKMWYWWKDKPDIIISK
jgi:hypothetical protein